MLAACQWRCADSVGKLAATRSGYLHRCSPIFRPVKTIQMPCGAQQSAVSELAILGARLRTRAAEASSQSKLVGRPNLQDLLTIYIDRMQKRRNGFYFKRFMRLVTLLGLG